MSLEFLSFAGLNPWFVVAQALGVITIIFEFISYQIKDKPKYFLTAGISSFFWTLMFVAIGMATAMETQLTLVYAATYSTVRSFVFCVIFTKNTPKSKEFGINFLILMVVFGITAGIATILTLPPSIMWIHILGLAAAMVFVVCQYLPGVHYVRISVVIYAIAVIITQTPLNILEGDFRWNIMGIMIELAKVSSVIVFYIKYASEPKRAQLQFEKP